MTQAKERPILFSGPMVRAILDGRKTVTRRVSKVLKAPHGERADDGWPMAADEYGDWHREPCPYGQPGDRLWVRETWGLHLYGDFTYWNRDSIRGRTEDELCLSWQVAYAADATSVYDHWRPSIHMPRWASRLTLEVVSVRVERLHDITEEDADREGALADRQRAEESGVTVTADFPSARRAFQRLWTSISGAESWDSNPWVWRVEFRKVGGR